MMLESEIVRLSGIAPAIWDASANAGTVAGLAERWVTGTAGLKDTGPPSTKPWSNLSQNPSWSASCRPSPKPAVTPRGSAAGQGRRSMYDAKRLGEGIRMTSMGTAPSGESPAGLDLADYLRVVRVYWKGIVALTLLCTMAAAAWTVVQPKIYSSDSSGIVVTPGSDNVSLSLAGDSLAKAKVKNYESVAKSRLVADRVIQNLELKTTADSLLSTISVNVPLNTAEIRVTAQSPDPATAQRVADAWVNGLAAQVQAIETATPDAGAPAAGSQSAPTATSAVSVLPLGKAVLPTSPVSPNVKLTLALGALVGLALGAAYALVRRHLDRRIRNAAEIERQFGVPVIGTLPIDHRLDGQSTILEGGYSAQLNAGQAGSAMAEASGNCAPTSASWTSISRRGSSW
ncbi:capsular polysaccharide biosynthesis protein CpsC [Arthrobacter sp. Hiyo6]|nr:capsular polysaccharide biosynthesis protein CpsC [Arthrobacter sp. Hiyo6]